MACLSGCVGLAPRPCPAFPPVAERDFLIIGHKGAPYQACENTLESFSQALALGANALEMDVSMTRDGHLVLWHDAIDSLVNQGRPTGLCHLVQPLQRRPIYELTLAEFNRDYGYERQGQRVAVTTLAAFVRQFARDARLRYFFLDLKLTEAQAYQVPHLFTSAMQILRPFGGVPKAVFTTPYEAIFTPFAEAAQHWYRTTGQQVALAFDTEGPQGILLGDWPSAVQRNQSAGTRFALWGQPVITFQSSYAFLTQEVQRRDAINATRPAQERLRFIVWTLNDQDDLCAAVGLGVDGIITDEPGRLRHLVTQRHPGAFSVHSAAPGP